MPINYGYSKNENSILNIKSIYKDFNNLVIFNIENYILNNRKKAKKK